MLARAGRSNKVPDCEPPGSLDFDPPAAMTAPGTDLMLTVGLFVTALTQNGAFH